MSESKNDNYKLKLDSIKTSYQFNSGAISSADSKARFLIIMVTLVIGLYSAFFIDVVSSDYTSPLDNILFSLQVLLAFSIIICILFSLSVVWPRFNTDEINELKAPQIFFFVYITIKKSTDRLNEIFTKIIYNIFPILIGRNRSSLNPKKDLKEKIQNLNPDAVLNEYIDQTWELAQIATRKMYLVRGSTNWFVVALVSFLMIFIIVKLL